jgi:hypothetical protein
MVQVPRFEDHDSPQLFFRFGERTIRYGHFPIVPTQGSGILSILESLPAHKAAIFTKQIVVRGGLSHECLLFDFRHLLPHFLVHVAEANVSHAVLLITMG